MEISKDFEVVEDLRQSKEYGMYMESIGWEAIKIKNTNFQVFIKRLGPVGIAKLQRTKGELPMGIIENILKENHVMMCKIEPIHITPYPPLNLRGGIKEGDILKASGYRLSSWPLLGTKTLRVDLRPAEDKIFNSFKKDCRYILRKVLSTKCEVLKNDYKNFYEIWKKSARRKNLWIPGEKEYKSLVGIFGKKVFCITVSNMAGALLLTHKNTAFYYYAGSTAEGTKLNLPYLVVWEAMKEAKKRNCKMWDFEGIYDPRWPNKSWKGFTHFKKSFGGKEIEFPGSSEKWRWPI